MDANTALVLIVFIIVVGVLLLQILRGGRA